MVIQTMDAKLFQKIFLTAAGAIEAKKEYINDLNVFPVPDGDTGTNMTMTILSAAKEVNALKEPTMAELAKAISSGSLRGARGNSGVILSQFFRGFMKEVGNYEEITTSVMARSMQRGAETAYKAVMKPKEGTILTVAREGAEQTVKLRNETKDLVEFFEKLIAHMRKSLERTPELLPVLKEAGVVDSGGEGLVTILEGMHAGLTGKEFVVSIPLAPEAKREVTTDKSSISTADILFGYCTEYIINVEKEYNDDIEDDFKRYLASIGDSIVVVSDDDVVKVHVHTNDPGLAIQRALTYGSLTNMKIDNMREEHTQQVIKAAEYGQGGNASSNRAAKAATEPRKDVGFISVSVGKGLGDIFVDLGVDYLIEGGQTMNPSTEDVLNAIERVNADTVFIFPNNSNIILTAEQARDLTTDKNVVVVPSKTIPQGITAIINYMGNQTVEENASKMLTEMKRVKSGQVTYAVRDTMLNGKEIKQGDIMGIGGKAILSVGTSPADVAEELLSQLLDDKSELISIYYGEEATEEDANRIAEALGEKRPDVDVEVHYGGQPIYYYIVSVE